MNLQRRRLLAYLGAAMIAGQYPTHEVEDEVRRVARFLGYPSCQIAALPTGIMLSLGSGEPSTYERAGAYLSLDQLTELNQVRQDILDGRLDEESAVTALTTLRSKRPRFGSWGMIGGGTVMSTGVAGIMQPGLANMLYVVVASFVVMLLLHLSSGRTMVRTLTPPLASFLVAAGAFWLSSQNLLIGPMRTVLPTLVVLLPGAGLVTGMAELAANQAVAGTSRLVNGIVQLMLLAFGISIAAWVLDVPIAEFVNFRVTEWNALTPIVGLALMCLGIMFMESVNWRLWPWIAAVLVLTFLAQLFGQNLGGSGNVAGFLGAFTAAFASSMASLLRPGLPRLVAFMPSFWLIVPGTLGLFSSTQLGAEPSLALTTIISIVTVLASLSMGLLFGMAASRGVAKTLEAQRRRIARRQRRRQLAEARREQVNHAQPKPTPQPDRSAPR